jgi:hypothetical protein
MHRSKLHHDGWWMFLRYGETDSEDEDAGNEKG